MLPRGTVHAARPAQKHPRPGGGQEPCRRQVGPPCQEPRECPAIQDHLEAAGSLRVSLHGPSVYYAQYTLYGLQIN